MAFDPLSYDRATYATGALAGTPLAVPSLARERQNGLGIPAVTKYPGNPIITPGTGGPDLAEWPDGPVYISVLHVGDALPAPIDQFYAYVGSHDGTGIWLATAAHPTGPWTWRQRVLALTDTSFYVPGHVSSPSALFHEGQVYLYVHGIASGWGQPTHLYTSDDGLSFSEAAGFPVIPTERVKPYSWYRQSTSYARIVKDAGLFYAVFQANGDKTNLSVSDVTTSVGLAASEDGRSWRVAKQPLFGNAPGSRGPFAPNIIKLWGKWLCLYLNWETGSIHGAVADTLEPGAFEDIGVVIPKGSGDAWDAHRVLSPTFLFWQGQLYVYYGSDDETEHNGKIGVAVIEWGGA